MPEQPRRSSERDPQRPGICSPARLFPDTLGLSGKPWSTALGACRAHRGKLALPALVRVSGLQFPPQFLKVVAGGCAFLQSRRHARCWSTPFTQASHIKSLLRLLRVPGYDAERPLQPKPSPKNLLPTPGPPRQVRAGAKETWEY